MASRIVMITSFKGGVGKSTVAANLAYALSLSGERTLLVDCDFKMRCLDLILGYEDNIVYDLIDALSRDIPLEKVIIEDFRNSNLFFCPAPYEYEGGLTRENFKPLMEYASSKLKFDYVIIDTPGESGGHMKEIAECADEALIVSNHRSSSIRAAERTAMVLSDSGVRECRLIINMFDMSSRNRENIPSIIDIVDKTAVRLIGIVPFDKNVADMQDKGILPEFNGRSMSNLSVAFTNIASRLKGENIPLFTGFKGIKRKKYIK